MPDNPPMGFDSIVTNPGRLSILTALAGGLAQDFVQLRSATRLTDGNLSTHARRLQNAGLIEIQKSFRAGKPLTTFRLTSTGLSALQSHAQSILAAVGGPTPQVEDAQIHEEDWVD
jgi:DNA-binding MarR family transcriptional regulator